MHRLRRPRWSPTGDLVLAVALCTIAQFDVATGDPSTLRVVCAALATLPIAIRQRTPLIAGAFVVVSWAVFQLSNDAATTPPVFFFATLPVIYSVGSHPVLRRAVAGGAIILLIGEAVLFAAYGGRGEYAFLAFVIILAWLSGRGARIYRDQSTRLRRMEFQLAGERGVIEHIAVAQERGRMAGELHDAIAHAVSLMVIQAGGAEQMIGREPDRVRSALITVQTTGRQAITELQRVLNLLRATPSITAEPDAPSLIESTPRSRPLLHPRWADLMLGVAIVVAFDARVFLSAHEARTALTIAAAGAILAIAIRQRHPNFALVIALMFAVASNAVLGDAIGYSPAIAIAITVYTVVVRSSWRSAVPLVAGAVLLIDFTTAATLGPSSIPLDTAWFLALVVGGSCVRMYRHKAERQRALTTRLLRKREARARLAVLEERARVARDLHDSVAHAVSVMVLQAGVAEQVLSTSPNQARIAIRAITAQGQQAHADLRHLLGLLDQSDERLLKPQPSLAQLDSLVSQLTQAGLPVTLQVRGRTTQLPTGLDISAYRIVQEGLTNALKHAGRVPTTVTLDYRPNTLVIEIRDSGTHTPPKTPSSRHGLLGMRERIDLYGGTLHTGHEVGTGFTLTAQLPLNPNHTSAAR